VDAEVAREILPLQPATRIPGAAPAVRGLVNVRGLLVTVIDAAAALGLANAAEPGGGAMLRLDLGAQRVGLVVDEVLDLVVVDDAGPTIGPRCRECAAIWSAPWARRRAASSWNSPPVRCWSPC